MAPSWLYGDPSRPWPISHRNAPITTQISTRPVPAVARRSIASQRSSRPGPPSPLSVSLRPPNRNTAPSAVISPRPNTPNPASPPAQAATRFAAPSTTENAGIHQRLRNTLCIVVSMKDLLHRAVEEPCQRHRQGQRRRVAPGLDRVDRLPRDAHRLRQLSL